METMTSNDEKIDALAEEVHAGFAKTGVRLTRLETRMEVESVRNDERFKAVSERFDEVDQRFDRIEGTMQAGFAQLGEKFDALQRTIIQVGGGLIGVLIVALVTVLATH